MTGALYRARSIQRPSQPGTDPASKWTHSNARGLDPGGGFGRSARLGTKPSHPGLRPLYTFRTVWTDLDLIWTRHRPRPTLPSRPCRTPPGLFAACLLSSPSRHAAFSFPPPPPKARCGSFTHQPPVAPRPLCFLSLLHHARQSSSQEDRGRRPVLL